MGIGYDKRGAKMTLDEAIKHAEEITKEQENKFSTSGEYLGNNADCQKCANEHRQLAEWLKDYKWLLGQEPCDDTISRQAAQAKIKSICDKYGLSYEDGERKPATGGSAYALGHAFDNLPPVTQKSNLELICEELAELIEQLKKQKQKSGKWIPNYYFYGIYDYTCSECKKHSKEQSEFCPNCGAKMESEVKE